YVTGLKSAHNLSFEATPELTGFAAKFSKCTIIYASCTNICLLHNLHLVCVLKGLTTQWLTPSLESLLHRVPERQQYDQPRVKRRRDSDDPAQEAQLERDGQPHCDLG